MRNTKNNTIWSISRNSYYSLKFRTYSFIIGAIALVIAYGIVGALYDGDFY